MANLMVWHAEGKSVIYLDELIKKCGFFVHEHCDDHCNNGYGCKHPDNNETDRCKNGHAECHAFACPVAYEISCPKCDEKDIETTCRGTLVECCECGITFDGVTDAIVVEGA